MENVINEKERFIKVGFWENELQTESPDQEVISCIEGGWKNSREAKACIFYMREGHVPKPEENFVYCGRASCRICSQKLGSSDKTTPDEKYLYPDRWWHYITEHSVKPKNEEFIQDALSYYEKLVNKRDEEIIRTSNSFIKVGFWTNPNGSVNDPEVLEHIVHNWSNTEEGKACVNYMENGHIPDPVGNFSYRGFASCRICSTMLGSHDLTTPDEKYVYPELWWHYITEHSVKPKNEEFIQDALKYYRENPCHSPKMGKCFICGMVFEHHYLNKKTCSKECTRLMRYMDSSQYCKFTRESLEELEKIALDKNLSDLLSKIVEHKNCLVNCIYCGLPIMKNQSSDNDYCSNYGCQKINEILENYDNFSIEKIMSLTSSDFVINFLLKKFHQISLNNIQRVISGDKKIQYLIKKIKGD